MLNDTITIQVSTIVLFVISMVLFISMIVLIYAYYRVNKRVDNIEKPKYGFLGKSLNYAFTGIGLGLLGIMFVSAGFNQMSDIRSIANEQHSAEIQSFILEDNSERIKIALTGVVFDNGEIWGVRDYDFEWRINGEYHTNYPIFEVGKNRENPSYIIVELPRDKYMISLKASSGNILVNTKKEIDLR